MYNGQLLQDAFVDNILNINFGYFLDIGAGTGGLRNNPINFYSNTYFLEKFRMWNGIAIDYDSIYIEFAKRNRQCSCVCADLFNNNINDILSNNNAPEIIDYLSFDVDDATEKVFNELDFNKYKFKVITFEHNIFQSRNNFQGHSKEHIKKVEEFYIFSRNKFCELGYHIFASDVNLDGYGAVEDWYISDDLYHDYKHIQLNNINYREVLRCLSLNI